MVYGGEQNGVINGVWIEQHGVINGVWGWTARGKKWSVASSKCISWNYIINSSRFSQI